MENGRMDMDVDTDTWRSEDTKRKEKLDKLMEYEDRSRPWGLQVVEKLGTDGLEF